MTGLAGSGAVAIWHDLAPEGRDEFYAWHGTEHMPERVGIAGFLRGRRYVAVRANLQYFNLYETLSPQVLTGPDYQQRLNNPTPWTAATVKHFRNVARSICRVGASFGTGQGGLVATWRYDVAEDASAAHIDALAQRILPQLAEQTMIAGIHLLIADTAASAVDSAERAIRGSENRIPRWVIVMESWGDEEPFAELCDTHLSDQVLADAGASGPAEFGLYRLQATCSAPLG